MRFNAYQKATGLCRVCGKPTKLLIHSECGIKADALKKDKSSLYKARGAAYKNGNVPGFAKR